MPDIQDAINALDTAIDGAEDTAELAAAEAEAQESLAETLADLTRELEQLKAGAQQALADLDHREQAVQFAMSNLANATRGATAGVVADGELTTGLATMSASLEAALGVDAAGILTLQGTATAFDAALVQDLSDAITAADSALTEYLDADEEAEDAATTLDELEAALLGLGATGNDRYDQALADFATAAAALADTDNGLAFVHWNDARLAHGSLADTTLDLDGGALALAALDQEVIDDGATALVDQATAAWDSARAAYETKAQVALDKQIGWVNARITVAQAAAAMQLEQASRAADLADAIETAASGL